MTLARAIKDRRDAAGLTQVGLAVLASVSPSTVHEIEQGRQTNPTLETLGKIAGALECPVEALLASESSTEPLAESPAPASATRGDTVPAAPQPNTNGTMRDSDESATTEVGR